MTTKDGDTPLEILAEDYKTQQKEDRSDSEKTGPLIACFHYLQGKVLTDTHKYTHVIFSLFLSPDLQKGLGHTNNRVVYSVFSRQAKDSDELSFSEGEQLQVIDHGEEGDQWWLAENIHGRRGLVPTTFLGPYRPPNLGTLL